MTNQEYGADQIQILVIHHIALIDGVDEVKRLV